MLNFKKLLFGLLLASVLSAALLAVAALCVVKLGLPSDAVSGTLGIMIGAVSLGLSCAITSMWAGERGMVYGVLIAALYSVLFMILSFILSTEIDFGIAWTRIAAYFAGGALGGILGVNRTQHIRF